MRAGDSGEGRGRPTDLQDEVPASESSFGRRAVGLHDMGKHPDGIAPKEGEPQSIMGMQTLDHHKLGLLEWSRFLKCRLQ